MNRLFFLLSFCVCSVALWAVRATPNPIVYTQPDGRQLIISLRGDEFSHVIFSEDGYTLLPDSLGNLRYATLCENGFLEPSAMVASAPNLRREGEKEFLTHIRTNLRPNKTYNSPKRAAAEMPSTRHNMPAFGKKKSLVILVNFSDVSFVIDEPKQAFTDLLNAPDYKKNRATGSARDYFLAASNGQFDPDFVVVGPYTLPQPMAYYGGNDRNGEDKKPAQMIVDACVQANAEVDFTEYDTDNDGKIDNVFVFYAGYNEAEGAPANTVWPHRWEVSQGNFSGSRMFDGKLLCDYACTSELKDNRGKSMCGIGTFCHEFGHVLGLPDYYHTTDDRHETLNHWDIMDAGSYLNNGNTPPTYSAYSRFYLGWLTPTELLQPYDAILKPINQSKTTVETQNQAYLIAQTAHNLNGKNPSPAEFFVLEYRKKTGWDTFLPAEGLLIWHIDYSPTAWRNNTVNNYSGKAQTAASHMRVYLQPSNGLSIQATGGAFVSGEFTPTLWDGNILNALWNGIESHKDITRIALSPDKEKLSFAFMGGTDIDLTPPEIGETTDLTMASFVAHWHDGRINKENTILYLLSVYQQVGSDSILVCNKREVADTCFLLGDLKPDTRYSYFVQGIITRGSQTWITVPSKTQIVKTRTDINAKQLAVSVLPIGENMYNLQIVKPVSSEPLFVYDFAGRLLYTDSTLQNTITIPSWQFPKGSIVIFKSGSRTAKWVF